MTMASRSCVPMALPNGPCLAGAASSAIYPEFCAVRLVESCSDAFEQPLKMETPWKGYLIDLRFPSLCGL
jgi:hypothetical protein